MFQVQLINQVVEWERRLEIEEERRKNTLGDWANDLPPLSQPVQEVRPSLLERIFGRGKERRPAYPAYPQEACRKTQAG